ncbi:MAG TPA: MFS transporter, partial [Nitrososphaerales archaeon]|nr:MFS transporter [Nitrososphaerales archaeon]
MAKPSRDRWLYSTFPISVATGPLGTMVQLFLIQLNGQALGTIYGGLAAAVYNGISIPAALFWGLTIDRLHKRKGLITLSYGLIAIALVSFYFDRSTEGTIARYGVISFVSLASATPLNLLIMETEQKSRWAGAFAKLSLVSSLGNVVGLMVSTLWADLLPSQLVLLFVPMGALSVTSSALSVTMIKEPEFVLERETVARRRPSFFSRLLANPVFFVTIPSLSDFRRAFRGIRSSLTRSVPLFYLSTILFYLSSGLFNTSFVPAMHLFSIPDQQVFAVILAGMVVQTVAFQGAGRFVGDRNLVTTSIQGLLLRGWSYLGVGAAALFLSGPVFVIPAMLFYPLAGGVAFAIYYTSANTMMFTTVQSKSAGAALGVYSAVVGIAAMGGSF